MQTMNTIQLTFEVEGQDREILMARLIEAGCEAFQEEKHSLLAFVQEDAETLDEVIRTAIDSGLPFSRQSIVAQNWNAQWEESFEPVIVPEFCTVRAAFHTIPITTPHEVIVTPKMSFGTGHHATTFLMMQAMRDIAFQNLSVFDFGTGTGILAILAEKLGAASVLAIDIDAWSVENAMENCMKNAAEKVEILQAKIDFVETEQRFDVVLANINRNVLLESMPVFQRCLNKGGILLLSGLLRQDENMIVEAAKAQSFSLLSRSDRSDWICLKFTA